MNLRSSKILAGQLIDLSDSSGLMSGDGNINPVLQGGMSSRLEADAVSPRVLLRAGQ